MILSFIPVVAAKVTVPSQWTRWVEKSRFRSQGNTPRVFVPRAVVSQVLPLEDRDVPEAHRGLHETLYSGGVEAEHGTTLNVGASGFTDQVGSALWDIDSFCQRTQGEKVAGVYGVVDTNGQLMYVGVSRNVALHLRAHVSAVGKTSAHRFRVRTFPFPKRSEMERVRELWIQENGVVPPGNAYTEGSGHPNPWTATLTVGQIADLAMSATERTAFEDKKYKLRKAMADASLMTEVATVNGTIDKNLREEDVSDEEIRDRLRRAMDEDDWSSEINAQTSATLKRNGQPSNPGPVESTAAGIMADNGRTLQIDTNVIVSPFEKNQERESAPSLPAQVLELNLENVDLVLDEVRPYLLSDGGNVSVVSISPPTMHGKGNGKESSSDSKGVTITLQLEGACGTCPSSTMTMKLGVERVLREKFGQAVGDVVALSGTGSAVTRKLSVEACDKVLDEVRTSLTVLGGSISVSDVTVNEVHLHYRGPPKLAYAIEVLLKEKLSTIQKVCFD